MGQGTDNTVTSFAVFDGKLIIGGQFTLADGQPAFYWVRWGCPYTSGDVDDDGDIDLDDFAILSDCMTGPDILPLGSCNVCDLDRDSDVDVCDFAVFQQAFTGVLAGGSDRGIQRDPDERVRGSCGAVHR